MALSATQHAGEAVAAFRKAVELNSQDERAHLGLAAALLQQRDLEGAVQHAADAERIAPDDPAAHTLLGLALLSGAKVDEAIVEFHTSLRLDPRDAEARDYLQQALKLKRPRS